MTGETEPSLDAAYALDGLEAVKRLYRDWARTYDDDFMDRLGYVYPRFVAELFAENAEDTDAPVLDVGCGSGAIGPWLAGRRIDGLDLSPEMLQVACEKGIYSRLIAGDLLARLPIEDGQYRGLVSTGTFTHGHVGPEGLTEVMRVAAPGALFCLGVNAEFYAERGFRAAFDDLHASGAITKPRLEDCPIYDGDHEHSDARALVVIFRNV